MTVVKSKRLGDLIELKRGYDLPASKRQTGLYPVISSAGISGLHNEFKVSGEGVITGRYGTIGDVYYIEGKYWPHNTALYVRDFKGNHPKYIYYLMRCLGNLSTSDKSAVPGVNRNELHEIHVPAIENLEAQKKVSEFLSTLDQKIELNNRINRELEGLAKLLYDYWFVQFDFPMTAEQAAALGKPQLTGKPYKTSGGPMVHNPELKREIPAGWEVSTLGQTCKTYLGGTPQREIKKYWEPREVSWLSSGENPSTFVMTPDEKISKLGLDHSPAKLLPAGSVILSIVRHLRSSILGIDAATNQSVVGILETDMIKNCFIYPYILREIPRLMTLRTGAQQPHINKGILDASNIVIPSTSVLEAYTKSTESIFCQIKNQHQQTQELTQLRDWLLPMLINGQVSIDR